MSPHRFLFTDYNRLSSVGGETSLAEMIATLSDACEREFGFLATRLFRVFKTEESQGGIPFLPSPSPPPLPPSPLPLSSPCLPLSPLPSSPLLSPSIGVCTCPWDESFISLCESSACTSVSRCWDCSGHSTCWLVIAQITGCLTGKKKWKKTCCLPSFIIFLFLLGCIVAGITLLAVFRVDSRHLTVNAVLISMASVVGLAFVLNCRTWWQVLDSLLNSQRKRLHHAASRLHKLKSEGFMKVRPSYDVPMSPLLCSACWG